MEDVSDFLARKLMERNIMKKIILDLDTGIDDTLALSYILGSEDAELIGITGTYGNVLLETGIRNDLNLLEMYGRPDIPVFKGVPHPSDADSFEVPDSSGIFHGRNGTGNVEVPATATRLISRQSISLSNPLASTAKKSLSMCQLVPRPILTPHSSKHPILLTSSPSS